MKTLGQYGGSWLLEKTDGQGLEGFWSNNFLTLSVGKTYKMVLGLGIPNANGKRYVHLHKKCLGLAEDFEMYRYPEEKEGKALKNDPVKDGYSDHGMDMVRYFFINRFPIRQKEFKVRVR